MKADEIADPCRRTSLAESDSACRSPLNECIGDFASTGITNRREEHSKGLGQMYLSLDLREVMVFVTGHESSLLDGFLGASVEAADLILLFSTLTLLASSG
jgi:hypothetical protein